MNVEQVTGHHLKLVVSGLVSLVAGGVWATDPDGSINMTPLGLFILLSVLCFWLVWWDIQTPEDPAPRQEE